MRCSPLVRPGAEAAAPIERLRMRLGEIRETIECTIRRSRVNAESTRRLPRIDICIRPLSGHLQPFSASSRRYVLTLTPSFTRAAPQG